MDALLLLLLDSRAPAGGHNHSAGMEPAIAAGMVRDLVDVEDFCRGRSLTSGRVAAAFAATACALWLDPAAAGRAAANPPAVGPVAAGHAAGSAAGGPRGPVAAGHAAGSAATGPSEVGRWAELDAEFEARTPSEAVRAASRQLGNGLRRMARTMLPAFDPPWQSMRPAPHHPIVLGAVVGAAGGTPALAARAAALSTITVPASAAVRLLGLDPFAVQAMLGRLSADIDAAGACGTTADGSFRELPADGAPALELLADYHLSTEVRLFAS